MSTVNGFQVGNEVLKYNYESLENYNTPNFSTSSSTQYAVGDYVTYQGKLYKCTTATTGGTWVSGSWELAILSDDLQSLGSEVEDLNQQISDLEDEVFIEGTERITESILSDISWTVGYVNTSGTISDANIYRHTQKLPVSAGDVFSFGTNSARFACAYSGNTVVSASGGEYVTSYTVPTGIDGVIFSFTPTTAPSALSWTHDVTTQESKIDAIETSLETKASIDYVDAQDTAISQNVFDYSSITPNTYINKAGTISSSSSYCVTDYIAVKAGNVIVGSDGAVASKNIFRFVTAYNSVKTAVADSGAENVTSYTVPSGIAFVRITLYTAGASSLATIYLYGTRYGYQPYFKGSAAKLASENGLMINRLYNYTLSTLPQEILKTLSYVPLGPLSKGYICLVSDDGDAALATYTIPMLIAKEVPGTFAVMSTSAVFGSQSGIDAVVEAVDDYGCCIAQHGGTNWTTQSVYDEYTFKRFLDRQVAYFDTLGLTPYGAVCPSHQINDLIRAICGGRLGCVRTGYNNGIPFYHEAGDTSYSNGPRSNLYGLTSQSSLDGDISSWQTSLDAVKTNHYLKFVHWHENEMTADDKTQLEAIIDYAKSIGLTFITMKDIPTIT